MPEPLAYLNGQVVPQSQLSISVSDAGFVFGATATEFVRTFHGQLFRLDDHIERFRQSCELCRIPMAPSDGALKTAAEKLVEHNIALGTESKTPSVAQELALVMFATPGPLLHFGGPAAGPTLAMHTLPLLLDRYQRLFTDGARLIVPAIRNITSVDPRAKMRSRMHWWIAEQQAKDIDPQAWALLLDADGFITETAAANVLIVGKGMVLSPPLNSILNGITLRVVKDLCRHFGIPFAERPFTLTECQAADEVFLTGTAFGLAGVQSIDGAKLACPGPVMLRLQSAFYELVGLDIGLQFAGSSSYSR
jgi:branched-subunit amino acid aminotransferase/4-amino-4-deoxychorismate lyase